MSSASSGLSRRALFGLGLAQLRERADQRVEAAAQAAAFAVEPPPAPLPTLDGVLARWAAADAAGDASLWSPVEETVFAVAAPGGRERLAVFDPLGDGPAAAADVLVSVFGMQRTPAGFAALAAMAGGVRPGGRLVLSVWTHGAVPRLLRAASEHDPLPPGLPAPSAWGRWERLRQDLDRYADEDDIAYHDRSLTLRAGSAGELLARLVAGVPALGAAPERLHPIFAGVLAPFVEDEPGGVRLAVPYLVVAARRRR